MDNLYEDHGIEIYWLGQMGLMVKTENTSFCIDYFASPRDSRQTPAPIPADELKGIDLFLGTHDHLDHIDHEAWKIWAKTNPDSKFIFPRAHLAKVLSDGVVEENAIGLNDGETVKVKDIVIHAIAASHEFLDMDEITGLYPHLQYIIEIGNVKLHHAGDTVRYEGMLGKIKAFGDIDIQMLPINGRDAVRLKRNCIGNMTYQEAADFAGDVMPKMVIPGHWDMFAHNSADPKEFEDYINIKYDGKLNCKIPKLMEKISY